MSDLTELKRLASLATPGPWKADGGDVCVLESGYLIAKAESTPSLDGRSLWQRICDQAMFIAAANPSTVLELTELIKAQRELLIRAEDSMTGRPLTVIEIKWMHDHSALYRNAIKTEQDLVTIETLHDAVEPERE